jgi:hypothetical protein
MFVIVILLLFSFVHIAQPVPIAQAAQTHAVWYFAERDGDLIAFTPDGEQNTIMSDFGEVQAGWRWDAETALFISEDDEEMSHLYRVTPQEATEIALPLPEDADLDLLRLAPVHSGDYLVLREATPTQLPSVGILINVAAGSAEILTGAITMEARFSDDQTLRYISVDNENIWSLLERSLPDGEEKTIYSFTPEENSTPFFSVNSLGDRWISVTRNADRQLVSMLINADGTIQMLDSGTIEQPIGWRFFRDLLVSNQLWCEEDCIVLVRDGDEDIEFTLPVSDPSFTVLAHPNSDLLLVQGADSEIMLLSQTEEPESLGEFAPQVLLNSPSQLISPDRRYVFTANVVEGTSTDREVYVHDVEGNQVFTSEIANVAQVFWLERGFIVNVYGSDAVGTVHFDDETSTELPYVNSGTYFEILPDNTLLYWLGGDEQAVGEPGIYRFDPASETFTSVVEGARFLYAQPIPML